MPSNPTVEESLRRALKTRVGLYLRKNLDGTFSVSISLNNPRRAKKAIAVRGYNLAEVLNIGANELEAKLEACELVP